MSAAAQSRCVVVADSTTHIPLPGASIFDRHGAIVGICNAAGKSPLIAQASYPLTIRCLGYKESVADDIAVDTIFLPEVATELLEVVVESKQHRVLHMLAYVREYSSLSSFTDTVFMFREKMVDYMVPQDEKSKFAGWRNPRVLKSKSYYRFTNANGLDSVSDECLHHYSWSDWIGIIDPPTIPSRLRATDLAADTLMGKYSPVELWLRNDDRIMVDVNVIADTVGRRWVPDFAEFFRRDVDFETFKLRYNYDNVVGDSIMPIDIAGYSLNIESNGRSREMFMFNKPTESFFVSTYAEVYIIDKEYITVKDARKWQKRKFDTEALEIIEPAEAPELSEPVCELIARVNAVNHQEERLAMAPDRRLIGRNVVRLNIAERAWTLFKQMTGISHYRMNRNNERNWREFRNEQRRIAHPDTAQ